MYHHAQNSLREEHSLVVIHDETQACPYIEGQDARMPLQWPMETISSTALDQYLDDGYRRSGPFLYRTRCPNCRACEPTRVDVGQFELSRSLRRVLNRGDRELNVRIQRPVVDDARVAMFNEHRKQRELGLSDRETDDHEYSGFLVETICETREISFWKDDQLIAVATTDFGRESMSLVYCFFDPGFERYSLGTYSILKHFEIARESGRRFVYLGMYVQSNRHLSYKARFLPQQRLRRGKWEAFAKDA